jgi:hypothetical protein
VVGEKVEIWYAPMEWFSDDVLPIAYQAVPKYWVAFQDIEVFIAPIDDLEALFGRDLSGERIDNTENPGGFVIKSAGANAPSPDMQRTLAV